MSNIGQVKAPPRPSSAGLREAVRLVRTMDKDNTAAQKLLGEMVKVQAHNEEVYKVASATLEVADRRLNEAVKAEEDHRESAKADAEALAGREAKLKERTDALAGKEKDIRKERREAADERQAHEKAMEEREQALQAGWAEQAQMKLTNDTRVEDLSRRASALDARQAEMDAYDSQLLDLIQSRAKTPQRSAGG